MSRNELSQKRLNVEGIDSELFQRFKVCVIRTDTTIKEVIIAHLKDYVKATENALKKAGKET